MFSVVTGFAAGNFLSRGETIHEVVQHFELKEKNKVFLEDCAVYIDDCIFTFSARSNFQGVQTQPLILYPDVYPAYKYYDEINVASLLEVVMGYWDEPGSPFLPEREISKIEALRMVMGAAGIYKWRDKSDLSIQEDNLYDRIQGVLQNSNWWYYFYTQFAQTSGFITEDSNWNPEDKVTKAELQRYIEKADQIARIYEKNNTSGDPSAQAKSSGS